MKRFTFMLLAAFVAVVALAAGPKRMPAQMLPMKANLSLGTPMNAKAAPAKFTAKPAIARRAAKKAVAAADLVGDYTWDYQTSDEPSTDLESLTTTAGSAHVTIALNEEGNLTISGMFPNVLTAYIDDNGILDITSGQIAGTSSYGDYALYGMFYSEGDDENEAGWYYSDILGVVGEDGTITIATWMIRILSGGQYDGYSLTPVWVKGGTLTPADPLAVVEAPADLVTEEYAVSARNYKDDADVSGVVYVGFDGNDVYVQGLCTYIPEAWVKGTLDGTTVTFAKGQYFGIYADTYEMYLNTLMGEDVVFDYDAEAGTLTAQNECFLVDNSSFYFDSYRGAVLKKVIEQAATPANPAITGLSNGNYGWYITFNVPNVDVDGNGLASSKLSYTIYTDIEGEITPLTFTPETHSRLTEAMTEIPYGFTEDYDFYDGTIYLNDLYSADWNKIGIQSIYRGGGEENVTEIQWFDIKDYAGPALVSSEWVAAEQGYENSQEVTEFVIARDEEGNAIVTGLADKADGSTTPKYYTTGEAVRLYAGNTLTIKSVEPPIAKIEFTMTGSTQQMRLEADKGDYVLDSQVGVGTWTGEESELVFTVPSTSQARIQKIKVFFEGEGGGDEPGDEFNPDDIDLPAYVYDFNDDTLQGWTTIDADGDGYDWAIYSETGVDGTSAVYSKSYDNNAGALNPDNYLVSPKLALDGCITFYACAQDASYPAEHFGVFVSTKGNEDAADFEQAKEWTLTAARSFNAPRKVQGNWYRYDVDLRGYEGQEGYVAIRHFNCTDQFYMVVDNITLKSSKVQQPDIVVDPVEGLVDALSTINLTFNNYEVAIVEGESAQAELYLNDNFDEPIATAAINVAEGKYLTINFDEQTAKGEYTVLIPDGTIQNVTEGTILPDLEYHYSIYPKDIVTLPEGVEAETWYLTASASEAAYNVKNAEVQVAINGTDIYIQGINQPYLPEAWVKGTINEDGTATFETGQFFGTYTYQGADYDMWFIGTSNGSDVIDVTFNFDAENGLLTTGEDTYIVISSSPNEFKAYEYYYDVEITHAQPVGPVEAPEGLETETYIFAAKQFVNPEEDGARKAVASAETTFDFNAMDVAVSSGSGATYNNAGDITEALSLTEGDVTLTVSPKDESASTPNRFWGTNNGPQLRVYSGTLTFEVPEGKTMSQIVFNNGKWNDDNAADAGEFDGATWTGDAQKVVVTIAGNTQINSIDVTLNGEGGGDEPVEDTDWEDYTAQVQVGFDGDDAYIQGLAQDCPELWVKATKNEAGQYVIPANQYMGTYDVGGYGWFIYDYYFTAVDEEGNLQDVVLNYDAETETFTTDQTLALNGDRKELYYYLLFQDVTISKMLEVAATPADPSVVEFNGTSSYPSVQFDIPAEDVDGNAILASKLFYTVWIETNGEEQPFVVTADAYSYVEEDMTEIPYTYDDSYDIYKGGERFYINPTNVITTWSKIGIQSIYYGAGERNVSNIVWMENPVYDSTTVGIETVKADDLKGAVIYNLAGQRLQTLQKGLNIINGRKVVIK